MTDTAAVLCGGKAGLPGPSVSTSRIYPRKILMCEQRDTHRKVNVDIVSIARNMNIMQKAFHRGVGK